MPWGGMLGTLGGLRGRVGTADHNQLPRLTAASSSFPPGHQFHTNGLAVEFGIAYINTSFFPTFKSLMRAGTGVRGNPYACKTSPRIGFDS